MSRWIGPSITLLALIVCAALIRAQPAGALSIGVGDQTSAMFSDPRFVTLGIHYARLDVSWDAMSQPAVKAEVQAWIAAARTDGVRPLITFDHSQHRGYKNKLPSVWSFTREFVHFRKAFPWIKDFAVWDEANYCGEPTCHHPALVAAYYKQMLHVCPGCDVVGAELLDEPNMLSWAREFRKALGREPMVWGLHNYIGANRLQSQSTKILLKATHAAIWFTETGGLVSRHNHSSTSFPESASHAAKVTEFVFSELARLSSRVKRVYIYQWDGPGPKATWDSGLIAPNGSARPAYDVFVRQLAKFGQLPTTRAAQSALASAEVFHLH